MTATHLYRGTPSGEILDADGQVVGRIMPVEPTEAQWGGLARDIVMWMDMGGRPTPEALFKHLGRIGRKVPQWLLDEIELQVMNRVPSKGTRAAIIYKAMLSAAPSDWSGVAVRVPEREEIPLWKCCDIERALGFNEALDAITGAK